MIILALFVLQAGCTGLFFQPDAAIYSRPRDWNPDAAIVTVRVNHHTMQHWLFPATHPKATIFFLHGNAQNISAHARNVAWLSSQGFNVFLFEYPGYGANRGQRTTLRNILRDTRYALDAIQSIAVTGELPLAIFGQSLGASIAIAVAAQTNSRQMFCGVIAESPFADYRLMAEDVLSRSPLLRPLNRPLSWTIDNTFSPLRHITKVHAPILLIHGRHDPIIPLRHSEWLFARARSPKELWVHNEGHIAFTHYSKGRHMLLEWLNRHCTKKHAGHVGPRVVPHQMENIQLP